MHSNPLFVTVGVLTLSAAQSLGTVTIANVGILAGGTYSYGVAISSDGSAVAGYADTTSGGTGDHAFRWTAAGGIQNLGVLTGGSTSSATGISGDGLVVGGGGDYTDGSHGFRWVSGSGMQDIGELPGGSFHSSGGHAVSIDGTAVVGNSYSAAGYQAFRWRTVEGIEGLGQLPSGYNSDARGVSSDGSVVTGLAGSPAGTRAFRWTAAGGMQSLGVLDNAATSYGWAINADGSVIVGKSDSNIGTVAIRWTAAGGMQSLGQLPGSPYSSAQGVSGDGAMVVGVSAQPGFNGYHAFLWKSSTGVVDLNTYLPTLGLDLTGWTLSQALAISSDGTAITGNGLFNGQVRGWVVRGIPGACVGAQVSSQPSSASICGSGSAMFSIAATGTGQLSYQWKVESPANSGAYVTLSGTAFAEPSSGLSFQVAGAATNAVTVSSVSRGSHPNVIRFVGVASNSCGTAASNPATLRLSSADFNGDGDTGTDADIESFFACLSGDCCATCGSADFNGDDDLGTDADIESFFRVLAGGPC